MAPLRMLCTTGQTWLTLRPDEARDNYQQTYESDNKAEVSHELVAGGASFAAFKMFEDRQRKEGKSACRFFSLSTKSRAER